MWMTLIRQYKTPAVIFSLFLISILVAGCVGQNAGQAPSLPPAIAPGAPAPPASPSPVSPPAASLIDKISQGTAAVNSYSLDSTISSSKSATSDKSDEVDSTIYRKIKLDISGRKMQMANTMNLKMAGSTGAPLVENLIYITGDTMYIQGAFTDEPQKWGKTTVTDNYWQLQNQAVQLVKLLQGQDAAALPPETVQSGNLAIPCDVLQVNPDLKAFWSLMAGQPGLQLPADAPPGVAFSQFIKNAQMKLWAARDSGLPVRSELEMSIRIGPAQVPALSSDVSMDISMSLLFYDYNKPVTLELPEEARNAADMVLPPAK